MTATLAAPGQQAPTLPQSLTAEEVFGDIMLRVHNIEARTDVFYGQLGVAATQLAEVNVPGPHRYMVVDETIQTSGAFKDNGGKWAVLKALEENPGLTTVTAGTAGNWGAAVTIGARILGLQAEIKAPKGASPVKLDSLRRLGASVDPGYADVMEAIQAAKVLAEENPSEVSFLHAFNNPDGIAGQTMVGRRLVSGLVGLHQEGGLDLHSDPVIIPVQIGGGSLITGVACAVMAAKRQGLMGDNVVVQGVRPKTVNGGLDLRYDGLAVQKPGSFAQAVLADPRFVQKVVSVEELSTGLAANRMAWALHGTRVEPSGLAGAAAFEQYAPGNSVPTTYVMVASGRNVAAARYEEFADMPGRAQAAIIGGLFNRGIVEVR